MMFSKRTGESALASPDAQARLAAIREQSHAYETAHQAAKLATLTEYAGERGVVTHEQDLEANQRATIITGEHPALVIPPAEG